MKINNVEVSVKIKFAGEEKNHPNILAYAAITLKEELGEYITISGFTVWKSLHQGYNVEPPQSSKKFKYLQGTLLPRIKQEIILKYEYELKYADIPVIEESL